MKKFGTVVGILVFCAGLGWGQTATYTWTDALQTGVWADDGNWTILGSATSSGPDSDCAVIIPVLDTGTYPSAVNPVLPGPQSLYSLKVDGGDFDLSGNNLTVSGNVEVLNSGALDISGATVNVGGNWNSATSTVTFGSSTLVFTGGGSLSTGGNFLNNVTVSGGIRTVASGAIGNIADLSLSGAGRLEAAGTLSVTGALDMAGTSYLRMADGGSFGGAVTLASGTTIDFSGGTGFAGLGTFENLVISGGTHNGNPAVNGDLSLSGAGRLEATGALGVTGALDMAGTSYLQMADGGSFGSVGTLDPTTTIEFTDGTGFAGLGTFANLTISGGTHTLSTDITVGGNVTVNSGSLNGNAGNIEVGGTWTVPAASWTAGSGTVTFNGTSQTVNGSNTFYNLICTGDTLFAGGTTQTVNGTFNATSATLLTSTSTAKWKLAMLTPADFSTTSTTQIRYCESVNYLGKVSGTNAINGSDNIWVFAFGDYVWTGIIDTDWAVHTNWDVGQSPPDNIGAHVKIPDITNDPKLGAAVNIGLLELTAPGSFLELDGKNLTVTGLANAGIIRSQGIETVTGAGTPGGTISYYGAVSAAPPFGTDYTNLTIEPTADATGIISTLDVSGVLTVNTELHAASITAGSASIGADIITTGAQTYNGAVTLTAAGTDFVAGTNTVTFNDAVDGDAAGRTLTVGSSTLATKAEFNGDVGGSLVSVHVYGTSSVGANVTTAGPQTYDGAVTLTADAEFTAGGGDLITFGDTVDGAHALTVKIANVQFDDTVGGASVGTALNSVSVDGTSLVNANITTTGSQTYTGTVTLGGTGDTRTFTAHNINAEIKFDGTSTAITPGGKSISVSADVSGGKVIFTGAVSGAGGGTPPTAITVLTDELTIGAAMSAAPDKHIDLTADTYTITSAAVSTTGTGIVYLHARTTGKTIEFGPTQTTFSPPPLHWPAGTADTFIDSDNFTGAANVTVGGAAQTGGIWLTVLSAGYNLAAQNTSTGFIEIRSYTASGSLTLSSGTGGIIFYGTTPVTVNTGGAQTYTGPSVLMEKVTFTSSGLVWFTGTVGRDDTERSLEVTNNVRFDGTVGGALSTTALNSISVGGTSAINTTGMRTTDYQTYTGAVTLGANVTFTAGTGKLVWFKNTVGHNGTAQSLTVVTADAQFDGLVGGALSTTALSSISVGGTSAVNTTGMRTTGYQTYTGAATLGVDGTVFIAGTDTVTFTGGVNGDATTRTLKVGDSSTLTKAKFGGATGGANFLTSIDVYGTSEVNAGTSVSTTGYQTYNGLTNNGSVQPGGLLTVNGITTNNATGTITAGNITSGATVPVNGVSYFKVIDFNGNYTSAAAGNLVGALSATEKQLIVFRGNAAFGVFDHKEDTVQFSISTLSVTTHDLSGTVTMVDVFIDTGNTVTLTSGTITQTNNSLTLNDNAVLNITAGSWKMGNTPAGWTMGTAPNVNPSGEITTPLIPFSTGFAGLSGELVFLGTSELKTMDFYTRKNASVPDIHTVTLPAGTSDMATITASGNVVINQTFSGDLLKSTLVMTGSDKQLILRRVDPVPAFGSKAAVNLGHFTGEAGGIGTIINSDIIVRGNVTFISGSVLRAGPSSSSAWHIQVFGNWIQASSGLGIPSSSDTHGNFIKQHSVVEFGDHSLFGDTYVIVGNTTFYQLVCYEKNATLQFANLPHKHFVEHKFSVFPSNDPYPADFKAQSSSFGVSEMMTVTRLIDAGLTPPYGSAPHAVPPMTPSDFVSYPAAEGYFWYFELAPGGEMETNWLSLYYSFSSKRVPLPPASAASTWRVDAGPYYDTETPDPNLGVPAGTGGSYYNVNWYVGNKFYYGFTEDSDGNGRIDRLRLQAAFELLNYYPSYDLNFPNADALEGFAVEVWDDSGNKYTVTSYERADLPRTGPAPNPTSRMDCLYVFLEEKPYSDGGAVLHWRIISNDKLRDMATRGVPIGEPGDTDKSAVDGAPSLSGVWDTVPPRINYALTIPDSARNEIFFQMSEPVDVSLPIVNSVETKTLNSESSFTYGSEFVLQIDAPFTVSALAVLLLPKFTLKATVQDLAAPAVDLRNSSGISYAYRFPPPKYPVDYTYSDYKFVQNNNFAVAGTVPIPNLIQVVDHRVTDVLISVPPTKTDDTQYFVWPLWAKYKDSQTLVSNQLGTVPGSGYGYMAPGTGDRPFNESEVIWDFTGKRFLEHFGTISLQARIKDSLSPFPNQVIFGFNVPEDHRASAVHGPRGLWLPTSPSSEFVNMVPYFYSSPPSPSLSNSNPLFNFDLDKTQYPASKAIVDFFFHMDGTPPDLFAGRLDIAPGEAIPSSWYRLVRPFTFELHDITRQRGGVTILNNVINSAKRERVFLDYRLTKSGRVTVQVFTLDGNLVKALVRESQSAKDTYYRVSWDGTNNGGRPVARGMYFIRIVAPEIDEIRKVMVVK
ncbi:MAG: hypothetical protein LBK74_09670 [Treponema sp.]|jgi:hypothetical protein|nr:hypothetical protein [Treponema sp.]